jgi:gluconolactonase
VKTAVVILCALSVASVYAQAGRAAAPPPAPIPPATETVASAIPGVVAAGTKVIVVKDGFNSTEGAVPLPDGSVLFTEPGASRVHKIDKNDNISTFLENTNRANGLALDSKGRLISVQALTVDVIYPKGSEATLAGPLPARPNDLVVNKKDGVYFTLPGATPPGMYYIPPGGKPFFLAEVASPHGISLSPDEKTLYVADINNEYLVAFDVLPDGKVTNRRDFGKYEGVHKTSTGFDSEADGVAIDGEGRIYVGTTPGVQVFSPKGQNLGVIPTSQRPQNLVFGGPDKKTLYLNGRSALFKVQMLSQGYRGRAK